MSERSEATPGTWPPGCYSEFAGLPGKSRCSNGRFGRPCANGPEEHHWQYSCEDGEGEE